MGSVTSAFPNSFKGELPMAVHDFTATTGDQYKVALIVATPTGDYGLDTTNYSELTGNADELPNGMGYTTGGFVLTPADNITPQVGSDESYWSWSVNPQWDGFTGSTSGCIIYNASKGNKVVYVGSFGGVLTVVAATLLLTLPANAPGTAVLGITECG